MLSVRALRALWPCRERGQGLKNHTTSAATTALHLMSRQKRRSSLPAKKPQQKRHHRAFRQKCQRAITSATAEKRGRKRPWRKRREALARRVQLGRFDSSCAFSVD